MLTCAFDSSRSGAVLSRELRTWGRGRGQRVMEAISGQIWVKVTIRNDVEGAFDDDARFFSSFRTGHPTLTQNA